MDKTVPTDSIECGFDKKVWLAKAQVFSSLKDEELDVIAYHSEILKLDENDILFNQDEPGDALYILIDGSIVIAKHVAYEDPTVIAELVDGDSFGELDLLTGSKRNATAHAPKKSILLRFPAKNDCLNSIYEMHPAVSAHILHAFLQLIAGRIRNSNSLIKENSPWVQELKRQVYGDKLTGLFNKTYLEEELPNLIKHSNRGICLLLLKPDNFKYINDTYGHEAGDATLKIMCTALAHHISDQGTVLRYMGNELGVILPETTRNEALQRAEQIRSMFNALDISSATGTPVTLSVSIGIAVYPDHGETAEPLIAAAHELPLVGRSRGGNLILFPEDGI
jgi:diguanylate cyclase